MRRALVILKYLPAVLCGFIALCFVFSQFRHYTATFPLGRYWGFAEFGAGTVGVQWQKGRGPTNRLMIERGRRRTQFSLGKLDVMQPAIWLKIPLLMVSTLLLPAAVLPLVRFRFPLWAWFAWTALVAAQLAYVM